MTAFYHFRLLDSLFKVENLYFITNHWQINVTILILLEYGCTTTAKKYEFCSLVILKKVLQTKRANAHVIYHAILS